MPKKPTDLLRAAYDLYERGLWIVPYRETADAKRPMGEWADRRWTKKEIGKALKDGATSIAIVLNESALIDVECDTDEAETTLLEMFGGEIPPTPTFASKRGRHRLFRRPDGLPHKAKVELDGVEFRIGNGKAATSIVPPSKHASGFVRYWLDGLGLDDVEPAELPPSIVGRLKESEPASTGDGERIPEGKRNDELFKRGCALARLDLPEATVATTLLDLNERLCDPPLPESEVRAIARSAVSMDDDPKVGFLNRLLGDVEFWHDENGEPFATLPQGDHRENWKIDKRSRPFRRWLSKLWYDQTGDVLKASDLADIAAMLEGKAVFDGPEYHLWRRTAEHEGRYFVDLCDPEWRAVEIDEDGWRIVSNPPVKFRRAKAMMPLPEPIDTPAEELRHLLEPFLNILPEQSPLVIAWLAAALRPKGPYPILKLLGEQGSAKTTTARAARSLVDPNAAPVRSEPRSTRDLMIAANNGWVICLDNLSVVKPDLSDALCRLATGGGFATRTLYTDDDETIFDATRPAILTSIEEIGTRSDLLERSLVIELPRIGEGARRTEKQFWREFENARPRMLGALLNAVAGGLRELPSIELQADVELPRLADFHLWGQAIEAGLGLDPGTFAEAYRANLEAATQTILESSPAVSALLRHLAKNPDGIEATASDLLDTLKAVDIELRSMPGWPKTPRVLSAILKRTAPNLRQVGIVAEQVTTGTGNDKRKAWRIRCDHQLEVDRKDRLCANAREYFAGRTGR